MEIRDNYGYTPLLKAVKYSAPGSVIDLLLEHGADVHAVAEDRKTVLHFAAQKNDKVLLRELIQRGLFESVNAEDKDGWLPLHEAARYGSEAAAAALIEKGAVCTYVCIQSSSSTLFTVVCINKPIMI